ncbi:MAG TPA: molybdenum cofactor synthesis domain-containing protein [Actinomycetota bacterium]|nr:molybdenum cofactor synthesis domain-containing protein [Actinomycetota bacterium]
MEDRRRAAILTVSDGVFHGTRTDDSGRALADVLTQAGFEIASTAVVADEVPEIAAALARMASEADLVVSTGGTGLGPRDVTPEATRTIMTREAPGLAETMRAVGRQASPMAIISRGLTGVVGEALVLNLPGSPKGAVENLTTVLDVLPHALQLLAGHTQHTASQTALPADADAGAPAATAPGPPQEHRHDHDHAHDHAHDQGAPEPIPAPPAPGPPAGALVGVGPSDVTLDLAKHLAGGEEVLLATAIRTDGAPPCQPGQKLLLGAGGPLSGTLGCSEFDVSAAADAVDVLTTGRPVLRTYHHDLGTVEVYLEPYLRRPRLVVLAATPVALWMLRWGKDLGYETILVESRASWITDEHRAAAHHVLADPAALAPMPGVEMEVVGTDHDAPDVAAQIAALLVHAPRFVGIMGSARHTGHHLADLKAAGVPHEQVGRVQSPVGLNIGAKTPPEIALSVLAGLLAARSGRPGGWIDTRTAGERVSAG